MNTRQQAAATFVPDATFRDSVSRLRIRLSEEAILPLGLAGTDVGSVHLSSREEAIPVGVVGVREPHDVDFATCRGHGRPPPCGLPLVTARRAVAA